MNEERTDALLCIWRFFATSALVSPFVFVDAFTNPPSLLRDQYLKHSNATRQSLNRNTQLDKHDEDSKLLVVVEVLFLFSRTLLVAIRLPTPSAGKYAAGNYLSDGCEVILIG